MCYNLGFGFVRTSQVTDSRVWDKLTDLTVCAHEVQFDPGVWFVKSALNYHSSAAALHCRQPDHVTPDCQHTSVTWSQGYLVPKSLQIMLLFWVFFSVCSPVVLMVDSRGSSMLKASLI